MVPWDFPRDFFGKRGDGVQTALQKAMALILTQDLELMHILGVTAKMSLQSSLIALLLGVLAVKIGLT